MRYFEILQKHHSSLALPLYFCLLGKVLPASIPNPAGWSSVFRKHLFYLVMGV